MERRKTLQDRRKFPRYHPDEKNHPIVTFKINGSPVIALETIDISKGGLMGYTSSIEHFIGMEDNIIKLIEVSFPGKNKYQSTGRILRLQPDITENRCYCAIEFTNLSIDKTNDESNETKVTVSISEEHSKSYSDDPVELETLPKKQPRRKTNVINNNEISDELSDNTESKEDMQPVLSNEQVVPDGIFIERLQNIKKNSNINDSDNDFQLLNSIYTAFDDVVESLTVDEKWMFYEILEEMIQTSPNYPEDLKQEFLSICQNGMKQTSRPVQRPM